MESREQQRVTQSLLDQTRAESEDTTRKLRKEFNECLKTAAVTRRDTKEATDKATENSKEMAKKVKAEHTYALANEKK
ncbi:hypothetical protein B484DRAFT_412422, partial [Ochromonadaceae sp. CCMP2298]